jgi:hypothetical protein
MNAEQLRTLHRAQPFRPFTLIMGDGSQHRVSQPEFLLMTRSGQYAGVVNEDDTICFLELVRVTEFRVEPPNGV